jgi:hypothetical protein
MAEEKEVATIQSANFVDKLRDRMKQTMIDLIPETQWNSMLKNEIDSFFSDKTNRHAYGNETTPSEFKVAVRKVLTEEIQRKVREMLSSEEWSEYWNGMEQMTGEKLGEFIQANGRLILDNWVKGLVANILQSVKFTNFHG